MGDRVEGQLTTLDDARLEGQPGQRSDAPPLPLLLALPLPDRPTPVDLRLQPAPEPSRPRAQPPRRGLLRQQRQRVDIDWRWPMSRDTSAPRDSPPRHRRNGQGRGLVGEVDEQVGSPPGVVCAARQLGAPSQEIQRPSGLPDLNASSASKSSQRSRRRRTAHRRRPPRPRRTTESPARCPRPLGLQGEPMQQVGLVGPPTEAPKDGERAS